ncbi:hypothetical protein DSL72_008071 [Monilinia vaccinii-corymbosi]|uniref:Uncharacterized protein n=1 Tax=Monilinia vaccinii-corymbosi TaxID=61207 RepID=A0A8A3PJP9_9HELO|nr:hypothetical protein DSL72_008071 [Monilinia vaccinii-corymbosi]
MVEMSDLGSSTSVSFAAAQQAPRPLVPGSSVGNANLQTAAAPLLQGQSQPQLPAVQAGIQINSAPILQGQIQPGQQNIQDHGQPLPVQPVLYQIVRPCGCIPGTPCQQHVPTPNLHPIVKAARFLACWGYRPIRVIFAFVASVITVIFTINAFKLAVWTATKDYIEYCQAEVETQQANAQCRKAAGQTLPPPPFFEYDPTNNAVVRRTIGWNTISLCRVVRLQYQLHLAMRVIMADS